MKICRMCWAIVPEDVGICSNGHVECDLFFKNVYDFADFHIKRFKYARDIVDKIKQEVDTTLWETVLEVIEESERRGTLSDADVQKRNYMENMIRIRDIIKKGEEKL